MVHCAKLFYQCCLQIIYASENSFIILGIYVSFHFFFKLFCSEIPEKKAKSGSIYQYNNATLKTDPDSHIYQGENIDAAFRKIQN